MLAVKAPFHSGYDPINQVPQDYWPLARWNLQHIRLFATNSIEELARLPMAAMMLTTTGIVASNLNAPH